MQSPTGCCFNSSSKCNLSTRSSVRHPAEVIFFYRVIFGEKLSLKCTDVQTNVTDSCSDLDCWKSTKKTHTNIRTKCILFSLFSVCLGIPRAQRCFTSVITRELAQFPSWEGVEKNSLLDQYEGWTKYILYIVTSAQPRSEQSVFFHSLTFPRYFRLSNWSYVVVINGTFFHLSFSELSIVSPNCWRKKIHPHGMISHKTRYPAIFFASTTYKRYANFKLHWPLEF